MRKDKFLLLKAIIAVWICIIIIIFINTMRLNRTRQEQEFFGVIDSINYTIKCQPLVFVKGEKFDMTNYWNQKTKVRVGDSIVKQSNTREVYIFRIENDSLKRYLFY